MEGLQAVHGVNLSGWLVLESWVTPELFAGTSASDDLTLIAELGAEKYNEVVTEHRESFITEADFREIARRGLDAVRIPVPWFVFGEAGPYPEDHKGCIDILDKAFTWANECDLKVLVAIALTPGAVYSPDGMKLEISEDPGHRDALLDVVSAITRRYAQDPAFLGIEPVDQVLVRTWEGLRRTPGLPLAYLRNFYRDAYEAIRGIAGLAPVVVLSDAGLPHKWKNFMSNARFRNVWLDCHLYYRKDTSIGSGPAGTRILVEQSREALEQARTSGLPVMVGEWSSALPFTPNQVTEEGRIALGRVYASAQMALFEECPAWFYQTWKTSTRDIGWDARAALASFENEMLD